MAVSRKQLTHQLAMMLSKDYETSLSRDSHHSLKRQCDRLASYAYIAVKHLEDNGIQDFLLIKHDDLREWYNGHKDAILKEQAVREAKQRRIELKERALLKLTDEEKLALGLKKK